jgi:hypothetical protein
MNDLEKQCYICGEVVTFGGHETLCDTVLCSECAKRTNDEIQQEITSQDDPQGPAAA